MQGVIILFFALLAWVSSLSWGQCTTGSQYSGVRGDTASTNSLKAATVNTGATIKVPLFINTGDKIRVDTRTREYYERIK